MKQVVSFIMLALIGFSIFFLIFIPLESYNVIRAWDWEATHVLITKSEIERGGTGTNRGFYLDIHIRDLQTETNSQRVAIRYGDIDFSIRLVSWLPFSTIRDDQSTYAEGTVTTAYRSPDGLQYVLEQNSLTLMIIIFLLSLIMPIYAGYHIITGGDD